MNSALLSLVRDESAVSSIEYALLGSLIAAVILVSVANVGTRVLAMYELVVTAVTAAA